MSSASTSATTATTANPAPAPASSKIISMTIQVPSGKSNLVDDAILEPVILNAIKEKFTEETDKNKVKRVSGGNNNENQNGGLARKSKKSMKKKSLKKKSLRRRR